MPYEQLPLNGSQEDESLSYDVNDQLLLVQPDLPGNGATVLKDVS